MNTAHTTTTKNRIADFLGDIRKALFAGTLIVTSCSLGATTLADAPLFSTVAVPGNLALALSVEWPTATSPAYSTAYAPTSTYLGYFDPEKCYQYIYNSTTPSSSYFTPYGASSNHTCTSSATLPLWSGNYMNWASMQTLDTFRWVLTGGYRSTDTTSNTILTKTYASYDSSSVIPDKSVTNTTFITGATPFKKWTSADTRVRTLGTAIYISDTGNISGNTSTDYNAQTSYVSSGNATYANPATVYKIYINIKACDSSKGVENNCVAYGSNYKPEGLLQKYSQKLRYAAFGYYSDSSSGPQRDGAVMRARMKYIAPTKPVPGSTAISNSAMEWDPNTGVMNTNPDSSDATNTQTFAGLAGWTVSIPNSGVMNYLNKFGSSGRPYKGFDPVSELYYTALRYFKNLGNVSTYTSLANAGSSTTASNWLDDFPAITVWDDPILYSCQKNFILGIGDVYSHRDANLPGSTLTSSEEPAKPSEVTADNTVNVTTATNMVGTLEGRSNLGSTWFANDSSRGNTYYIAGLAYDAHTKDIRSDLTGKQTINTYWLDIHEGLKYNHKNQFWLAAKYGGFDVSDSFSPYATTNNTSTLAASTWYTSTDTLPFSGTTYQSSITFSTDATTNTSDKRPDNYFPGNSPLTMKTSLENAFLKIVSEAARATSTTISTPTPRQSSAGNANYKVSYDPNTWTSSLKGQLASFDNNGNATYADVWDATAALDSRTSANRLIITCCTSTGAALPFTNTGLTTSSLDSRTYYSSFGSVTGVTSTSQSVSNYISYLRGSRTNELSASGPYRTRTHLLGDVVNSKLTAVGAPNNYYFDLYNPGYGDFKSAHASRPTVVYVGANDGMMHAFDGTVPSTASGTCSSTLTTPNAACGKELFAYIPSFTYGTSSTASISGLASLGNPSSFSHHYLVDATPISADVDFFNTNGPSATTNDWRTILVGGLGKGGQGYYAIDITDPSSWTSESIVSSKVLWEFTNAHMGYTFGDPIVVKTPEFGWTVILPSGYNNDDGKGYFFFINPRTGALLKTIATPEGSTTAPINLANIQAFVPSYRDFTADTLYAGDLQGNIWRIDLTSSSQTTSSGTGATTSSSYDYTIIKFAHLTASDGTAQPVTTKPLVEVDSSSGKRYVLVGTGQLLSDNDVSSTQRQSLYAIIDGTKSAGKFYNSNITTVSGLTTTTRSGIALPTWDNDSNASTPNVAVTFPVTRSHLVANTNLLSGISSSVAKPMGWYFDLSIDTASGIAERINIQPAASTNGIIAFAANLPNGNVCSPAGSSKIYAINFSSGTSTITDSSGNIIAYNSMTSSTTDITFMDVNGATRLYTGSGDGTVTTVGNGIGGGSGGEGTTPKQFNWREVPTAD